MKFNQLRDFVAVARAGSIHQAARDLGLSQPALTKSVRQLEKELGTPLFQRTAQGAVLNEMGRRFLRRAEVAANELSRGQDEVAQLLGGQGGRVALALSATPSLLFLPNALKVFRQSHPLAEVRIVEGLLPVMLPALRDSQLDFVLAPEPAKSLGGEFAVSPMFAHQRAVVCRKGHPLSDVRSLAGLVEADWVLTAAAGPRSSELDDVFRSRELPVPRANVQCESLMALVSLLANTDLIALLPEPWLMANVTAGLLTKLDLDDEIGAPAICLIQRKNLPLTPVAEAFSNALHREAEYLRSRVSCGARRR
ncbi:LysR substrate-binding domain-containing protein [Pigmentiphaga sp.]|uniref:LysR substrate-binding domain-containing protein n=1 Tax=Pigmentiphaga sp. TaxID=1977564 RepID=UPI0025EE637B|nr:LysR substrate-binding domain-containing protein [Pigmentiphaga sp.]